MILFIIKRANFAFKKRNLHLADKPPLLRKLFRRVTRRLPLTQFVSVTLDRIGEMPFAWFTPLDKERKPLEQFNGAIFYCHGGGYVIGDLDTHRSFVGQLAHMSGREALLFEYRKAPEHPYPAAIDDALSAYRYLQKQYTADQIVFCGDSAGGGLAAALLLKLRDLGEPMPRAAVLLSPFADLTASGESLKTKARVDPVIEADLIQLWAGWYAGRENPRNPYISPIFGQFKGLPPMLIQVGTEEVLLDDSLRLAEAAKRDGVQVELRVWERMIHVWQFYFPYLPAARRAIREATAFMNK